jgi:predicted  nucleic acid-binding Zn-ribbon protein
MEANLEKKLMSTLQTKPHDTDKPMEPSPLEARVTQLERQLSQVHMSQTGLENKVGSLQVQIDQQSHLFGQALDSKLAEQMDKIESFLIKRSRHE